MACRTASVQRVADKTISAKSQLEKLEKEVSDQKDKQQAIFYAKVTEHLRLAKIADERELDFKDYIKTEYTSEFSLDAIAKVVTQSLKTIAAVKNAKTPSPAFSNEAVQSYTDLVNTVAEAAKSSSSAASTLSFSMNRLAPGIFAFLSAASSNAKDDETFGKESITSTVVFYRIVESIDDLKNEGEFNEAQIDYQNLQNVKTLQAALSDDLANGKLTFEEWMNKDKEYEKGVKKIRTRLRSRGFSGTGARRAMFGTETNVAVQTAKHSLLRLTGMGGQYSEAVVELQRRLDENYFLEE